MIYSVIGQWLLDGKSPHTELPVLETRRVVKPGDRFTMAIAQVLIGKDAGRVIELIKTPARAFNGAGSAYAIYSSKDARKWHVGQELAIQLGRGQRALGRTPPIASIRRQDVRAMTQDDARDSGFNNVYQYLAVWCEMHDPQVTIFEVVPGVWLGGLKTEFKRGVCWGQDFMLGELYQRPADRYDAWVIRFEGTGAML